jgi:hypothetical protein
MPASRAILLFRPRVLNHSFLVASSVVAGVSGRGVVSAAGSVFGSGFGRWPNAALAALPVHTKQFPCRRRSSQVPERLLIGWAMVVSSCVMLPGTGSP